MTDCGCGRPGTLEVPPASATVQYSRATAVRRRLVLRRSAAQTIGPAPILAHRSVLSIYLAIYLFINLYVYFSILPSIGLYYLGPIFAYL